MKDISSLSGLKISSKDKILAVFAHPDDETMYCGGLIVKACNQGIPLRVLTLTNGEKSTLNYVFSDNLVHERKQELSRALVALGCPEYDMPGFPDGNLVHTQPEVTKYILGQMRQFVPTIILTIEPSGVYGHPDHIAVTEIIMKLDDISRQDVRLLFATVDKNRYIPSSASLEVADPGFVFDPLVPGFRLHLSLEECEKKIQALGSHCSQFVVDDLFINKWNSRGMLISEYFTYYSL